MRLKTYIILALILSLTPVSAVEECWLCRRSMPPNPLTKVYYTEAHSLAHLLCQYCLKDKPKCSICAGPTSSTAEVDGRTICPECKKVGIDTPQKAEGLYKEIQQFVEKLTAKKIAKAPPMRLILSDEMDTLFAERSGRSFRAHAFYSPYNPEMIYLLSWHSPIDLGPTLAHEYTHAWQSRFCPSQDRMVSEGFATWVGYKYAQSKGYTKQMLQMQRTPDPDYAEGLKRCLELEKKLGAAGLTSWMQKNSRW